MTGEKNLEVLLAAMHPVQRGGEYVYAMWPDGRPLVPGVDPPRVLFELPPNKVVGLTVKPDLLAEIRFSRLSNLGLP
ncbi:MAG: ACT domain-containing protein, partial [Pseudarthrobacter sp.]